VALFLHSILVYMLKCIPSPSITVKSVFA